MISRLKFLQSLSLPALASLHPIQKLYNPDHLKQKSSVIVSMAVHVLKVNERGNWVFIALKTKEGLEGFGEASHSAPGASPGAGTIQQELSLFFEMVKGRSSFNVEGYRALGWDRAKTSRTSSTAFSAIEQALWDLNGKFLSVPVHQLLGGKVRDKIKVYANINRATNEKDANGRRPAAAFQRSAEHALAQGFRAIKMAPFDEMKPLPSTPTQIKADIDHAVSCLELTRQTIGNDIELLVDVHSHLDENLSIEVAKRIEPLKLYWYEEPVNPEKFPQQTKAISDATEVTTAGGESIFGGEGFFPLISTKALDIFMPDVKHCGGIQELKNIAAMAHAAGLSVAPHNPSGPVATAASVQVVATIQNFAILELAHGEVPWRPNVIAPVEEFIDGYIAVSDRAGLGLELNLKEIGKHQ